MHAGKETKPIIVYELKKLYARGAQQKTDKRTLQAISIIFVIGFIRLKQKMIAANIWHISDNKLVIKLIKIQ